MIRPGFFGICLLACATPAFAHHGGGSFDLTKSVTFTGVLTKIELINPHSWLYFDVKEADGKMSKHRCEMRSSHVLRRSGWSNDLFPVGQQITVEAAPDRVDPSSCYLNTIRFANGSHMDRYGQYVKAPAGGVTEVRGVLATATLEKAKARPAKRPSGEPNLAGDWAPEQVVMADPRGTGGGLVPLSTLATAKPAERGGGARRGGGPPAGPRLYGGTELTPEGEKAAAAFKREDNPRFSCLTTSILFDWTFDGPVNRITQNKDTIVIEYGQMNLKRTVYMNQKTHPTSVKLTRAGHSIGSWEGDTLVVDTVGFQPGVLNAPVRHSDKLHVVERFTYDPAAQTITRTYTAEDPAYLKGQYTGRDVIGVADQPYTEDKCKEQGFIDYSKQTKR
ncbi:MAG TPA: DUF6152 family protein [Vicinamibacterales bacterium]|jgi:hypothetical protein|nr:DUF6152 family protein [Vicinamibacterales bacterium]